LSTPEHLGTAVEIARAAGRILLDYQGRVAIEYKGSADLVTAADRASEEFISGELKRRFPEHRLVAEEGARRGGGSEYLWYVDPLDGTTNFAHGLPFFAVSMGLEYRGEIVAGAVFNPRLEEMFTAERGGGAQLNGERLHVSATPNLDQSLLATGFPAHSRRKNPNVHLYHAITLRSHGVRRYGSAALDLCYVAAGRFDGFWEFGLNPWDTAAGALILTEAGGRITDIVGGQYRVTGPEVVGTNGLIHDEVIRLFGEILAGKAPDPLPSAGEYLASRSS
jgi:myo-inositol-1(or 4)-monophosphatase